MYLYDRFDLLKQLEKKNTTSHKNYSSDFPKKSNVGQLEKLLMIEKNKTKTVLCIAIFRAFVIASQQNYCGIEFILECLYVKYTNTQTIMSEIKKNAKKYEQQGACSKYKVSSWTIFTTTLLSPYPRVSPLSFADAELNALIIDWLYS